MAKYDKRLEKLREILEAFIEEKIKAEDIEWMEEQEVMDWLRISRSTLYRWRKNRVIIYSKLGGRTLYPKQLLQKYFFYMAMKNTG